MLYDAKLKQDMLDALHDRVSSICDICVYLINEGMVPNKKKYINLSWVSIMIDAYQNVDVLSVEQHKELDNIYNTLMG